MKSETIVDATFVPGVSMELHKSGRKCEEIGKFGGVNLSKLMQY